MLICTACGAYAVRSPQSLLVDCPGAARGRAGAQYLARVRRGKYPHSSHRATETVGALFRPSQSQVAWLLQLWAAGIHRRGVDRNAEPEGAERDSMDDGHRQAHATHAAPGALAAQVWGLWSE